MHRNTVSRHLRAPVLATASLALAVAVALVAPAGASEPASRPRPPATARGHDPLPARARGTLTTPATTSPWQAVTANPGFTIGPGSMELLTNGSVVVQDFQTGHWWELTPNDKDSYVHGTWSEIADMPGTYAPTYYASAVLPDGRMIVEGGEFNGTSTTQVESKLGAVYDPVTNTWTSVKAPAGWTNIGDAPSAVLPDGRFMLGDVFSDNVVSSAEALLDPTTLTWTTTGSGKADDNEEEGWSLLPDGDLLTVDTNNAAAPHNTELYSPAAGAWTSAGNSPVGLVDVSAVEVGPLLLMPDGDVFAAGATGANAVFDTASRTWSKGPRFPIIGGKQYDVADGPAAVLPDGNVLVDASPRVYQLNARFFVFNGTTLTRVASPPGASTESSFYGRMLVLPTGQVLFDSGSGNLEVYTATGTPKAAWAPQITAVPTSLAAGGTYTVAGTQLNGLTQGAAYGDDYQCATNYPLVRITNTATHDVSYARTFGMTSMSVAPKTSSSASFTLPAGIATGPSTLQVVANGIASTPVAVTIS